MININERILAAVTGDELITLCHIAKRINRKSAAFPSIETLRNETGFGREKMEKIIRSLCKKGIMRKEQRKADKGKFSSNLYTITTKDISIFVSIDGAQVEEKPYTEKQATDEPYTENPTPDFPATVEPCTVNPATKYYNNSFEVLSFSEVLSTHTHPPKISENSEPAKPAPDMADMVKAISDKVTKSEKMVETWRMKYRLTANEVKEQADRYAEYVLDKDPRFNGLDAAGIMAVIDKNDAARFQAGFSKTFLINYKREQPKQDRPKYRQLPQPEPKQFYKRLN